MIQNLAETVLGTKSLCFIFFEHLPDEILGLFRVLSIRIFLAVREHKFRRLYFLLHFLLTELAEEWDITKHHFESHDADSPPVDSVIMASPFVYLWRHILRCTNPRFTRLAVTKIACKSEINDFQESVLIDEDVLKFQISVRNSLLMEIADTEHDLSDIKLDLFLVESLFLYIVFVKLCTTNERHHKIKPRLVMEHVIHPGEEWMLAVQQDAHLYDSALYLVLLQQDVFADTFDRVIRVVKVDLIVGFDLSQIDFSVGASS